MQLKEFKNLYYSLNEPRDLKRMASKGYDERLIETIYTQKVSRDVKRRFHMMKAKAPSLLREWKSGSTLMDMSRKYQFSPILLAMMVFQEDGIGKKGFWELIRHPELADDERLTMDLIDVVENDYVYSPWANDRQRERGEWGEGLLWDWLDDQSIEYQTEDDMRDQGGKTPDCLLKDPLYLDGKKICWIESKASFGDSTEFKFNSRKQLIPYTELFGPGVVVYWTGHLDAMECPENVYLEDIGILEKRLKRVLD